MLLTQLISASGRDNVPIVGEAVEQPELWEVLAGTFASVAHAQAVLLFDR